MNNLFKIIFIFITFLLIIKCEYIDISEKDIKNAININIPLKKWENGIVYYKLYWFSEDEKKLIRKCMDIIEYRTDCIFFIENKAENKNKYIVKIVKENKNYSIIGCSEISYITLKTVNKKHINHELMHCLGFRHEHQRPDRDQYIKINFENIKNNKINNFTIIYDKNEYIYDPLKYKYDYKSILHYRSYSFSKNNKKTIEMPEQIYSDELSEIDILKIKNLYKNN
jgi:hypothetical protein